MADVMEVAADLVQSPGLGPREHERTAVDGRPRQATKARHRNDAFAPFASGDRVIDDAPVGRRAPHQGKVALLHAASLERLPERRCCLAGARKQQRAARAAVEAMHGMNMRTEHVSHRKSATSSSSAHPRWTSRPDGLLATTTSPSTKSRSIEGDVRKREGTLARTPSRGAIQRPFSVDSSSRKTAALRKALSSQVRRARSRALSPTQPK
jgi:hypothetical protein